jgi:Flp pilus assembly protein TadD
MVGTPSQTSNLGPTIDQALAHHRAGRFQEAERLYRGILQSRPDDPAVNNALAIVLKDQNRVEEAEAVLERVIAIAPDYAAAHTNFGNIRYVQGRLEEAEASYRRALAARPDTADALRNLGLVIFERGRFDESIPWFHRHAGLVYAQPWNASGPVPEHKTRHDREQRDYLSANGRARRPRISR